MKKINSYTYAIADKKLVKEFEGEDLELKPMPPMAIPAVPNTLFLIN
ncbi:unnamed protein product [marine sediment metagenome]|uniref:Uncharacterized protein n=1 Tax=marine sediment metagenome TaxID=412755 RepID=X1RK48_9ZZZZ